MAGSLVNPFMVLPELPKYLPRVVAAFDSARLPDSHNSLSEINDVSVRYYTALPTVIRSNKESVAFILKVAPFRCSSCLASCPALDHPMNSWGVTSFVAMASILNSADWGAGIIMAAALVILSLFFRPY